MTNEALSQERPDILECYHCDPADLQVRDPSKTGLHATRMACLTDDDDLGELRECNLNNGLCVSGKIDWEGNMVNVRRCQQAEGKAGTCEEVHIMDSKGELCFCDTAGCNGTNGMYPQSFAFLLGICGLVVMMAFK